MSENQPGVQIQHQIQELINSGNLLTTEKKLEKLISELINSGNFLLTEKKLEKQILKLINSKNSLLTEEKREDQILKLINSQNPLITKKGHVTQFLLQGFNNKCFSLDELLDTTWRPLNDENVIVNRPYGFDLVYSTIQLTGNKGRLSDILTLYFAKIRDELTSKPFDQAKKFSQNKFFQELLNIQKN